MNDKFPNNIKELRQIEFESSGLGKAFRIAKNIVKLISRTGTPKWSNVVHQRPNNITEVLTKIQHLDVVEVTTYSDRLERLNFEKAQTDITEFSKILIHLKRVNARHILFYPFSPNYSSQANPIAPVSESRIRRLKLLSRGKTSGVVIDETLHNFW